MQETLSNPDGENIWIKNGQYKLFTIMVKKQNQYYCFNPKLHPIVHDAIADDQGRLFILDCTIFTAT